MWNLLLKHDWQQIKETCHVYIAIVFYILARCNVLSGVALLDFWFSTAFELLTIKTVLP
jgi:hypothetical protein